MTLRIKSVVAVTATAGALMFGLAPSALAKPGGIDYGRVVSDTGKGDIAYAYYTTGTGSIRSILDCDSGDEHYEVYGPWVSTKNKESFSPLCAHSSGSYYQTKS